MSVPGVVVPPEELQLRQRLKDDFEFYASKCLFIRTKAGGVKQFELNDSQRELHRRIDDQRRRKGFVRLLVLKGRQQGISTYTEGRFYWKVSHRRGVSAFILTHEDKATQNLFAMVRRYHEHCPEPVRPHTSNSSATELVFDRLDSRYGLGTARTKATGRSLAVQFFHGSEVAFWPNASTHVAGIMQAIPRGDDALGTEVILESTANGVSGDGGWFYQSCMNARDGLGDFELVFLPWFLEKGYREAPPPGFALDREEREYALLHSLTVEQMAWRRAKRIELGRGEAGDKLFRQEYPATIDEAFLSDTSNILIRAESVIAAQQRTDVESFGAVIFGVDVARFGDDKSAIVIRQGRKVLKVVVYGNADTMVTVGIVYRLIQEYRPRRVFVDEIGVGAGVVDRLREIGYADVVIGVNSAAKALEPDRYYNLRSEMYCRVRDWLEDESPQLPPTDQAPTLLRDLAGTSYRYDTILGRIRLDLKEDIKKALGWSPDAGDALALTFAYPVPLFETGAFEPGMGMAQERAIQAMESFEPD